MRIVVRRTVMGAVLLLLVSAVSFVSVALTPGDAARQMLGLEAPESTYRELRLALGLDLPVHEQYWRWITHAIRGDLGVSFLTSEPVTHAINARLPVTASLILGALLLSFMMGVPIGVLSAVRGGAVSRSLDAFALVGFALPSFWLGAVLITLFAVRLHWFPATGYVSLLQSPSAWFISLVLPVTALALHGVAAIGKQTREAMSDALTSEYVRMAWASGVSPASIVFRHAFKNAALRVVTILGLQTVGLLGGTVFIEAVFALPGLGGLAANAAVQHDLPVIQGVVVYFTVIVVLINLVIDLAYSWLDPRVRAE